MPTCVRKAWLVHPNGATIQLDNPAGGWMCQSLDLGTPIMRTVMSSAPDQDGIIDRTQYMAARTVVAAITAMTGAGAQIDAVAASFAPYMVPSVRPVLHYVLDRPGAPERTLTLRPDSYDWPIVGATQRDIALQWIAPNPISYGPTQQSITAPTVGVAVRLNSPGDVPVRPIVQITGPITGTQVTLNCFNSGGTVIYNNMVALLAGYVIPAGSVVTVDCGAHTAVLNGAASVLTQIDWTQTNWPVLVVNPGYTNCALHGSATTAATLLTVLWNDGYLT
jgi:hypothetical protein